MESRGAAENGGRAEGANRRGAQAEEAATEVYPERAPGKKKGSRGSPFPFQRFTSIPFHTRLAHFGHGWFRLRLLLPVFGLRGGAGLFRRVFRMEYWRLALDRFRRKRCLLFREYGGFLGRENLLLALVLFPEILFDVGHAGRGGDSLGTVAATATATASATTATSAAGALAGFRGLALGGGGCRHVGRGCLIAGFNFYNGHLGHGGGLL